MDQFNSDMKAQQQYSSEVDAELNRVLEPYSREIQLLIEKYEGAKIESDYYRTSEAFLHYCQIGTAIADKYAEASQQCNALAANAPDQLRQQNYALMAQRLATKSVEWRGRVHNLTFPR